ncbi:efflux RND transporter periplasmic adaptor subunit [Gammaproteobacteria bacterium]|jgi:RND family efflux transporter MFP subunit|nr:efflux RND transporter periplasmic adaptor subunit [Gammaproteobacteria bacterium]
MKMTLLAGLLLASSVLHAQTLTLNAEQRAAFGIETAPVQLATEALSKPYPAKVQVPNAQLRVVSASLEGVVEALLVAEGESVEEGQTLARVRSQGLLELQATYLETATRRALAAETLARDKKLYAEGIVAKRRLLESQSAYRELSTTEERDRQSLLLAGLSESMLKDLARDKTLSAVLEVKAPLSGVVLEQMATSGQRLAVSDPLYRVGQLSPLWIEVHVPLNALGTIAPGSLVRITEGELNAEVITVGRMVHGTDQGVLVRAEVREGVERLRPGQFVEAQISQGAGNGAFVLPAQAVVRMDGQDRVFVQRARGFELLAVEVLSRERTVIVVRADLESTDSVVISGTAALKAAWAGGAE